MAFDLYKELGIDPPATPVPATSSSSGGIDPLADLGLKNTSALGEIGTGLTRSVLVNLPSMAGQAMQWAGEQGGQGIRGTLYSAGQRLAQNAQTVSEQPDLQLHPDQHGTVVNALASGAEQIAPSVAAPLAIAGGLSLLPEGTIGGLATLGLSAVGGALPAGMSQAQQTYENVKAAGRAEDAARIAGWKSGAIETGGESLGNILTEATLGMGGTAVRKLLVGATEGGVKGAVKAATDTSVIKPLAKSLTAEALGETATEMGQQYGEAQVEKNAGVNTDPWTEAKGAIAPTLGMVALLAPLGLVGHFGNARRAGAIDSILADPQATTKEDRLKVVNMLHGDMLSSGVDKTMANDWRTGARQDIANGLPIRRDVGEGADPAMVQAQQNSLSQLVGSPVSVANGIASFTTPNGQAVNAPVDSLAQYLAGGGSVDTLNTAQLTAPKLDALRTGLGTDAGMSYQGLVDLYSNPDALQAAGLNQKDVGSLLLDQVRHVEGGPQIVQGMLDSGIADPKLIDKLKSGEFTPDPMAADWARQQDLARATNRAKLQQINTEEQRIQAQRDLVSYWQSQGMVDTPEDGQRQLDAWNQIRQDAGKLPMEDEWQQQIKAARQTNQAAQNRRNMQDTWTKIKTDMDSLMANPVESVPPEGTPPVDGLPPSPSVTPSEGTTPLWQQAGLHDTPGMTLSQIKTKANEDGTISLLRKSDGAELFPGTTFADTKTAKQAFIDERQKAREYNDAKKSGAGPEVGGGAKGTQGSESGPVRLRGPSEPGVETQGRSVEGQGQITQPIGGQDGQMQGRRQTQVNAPGVEVNPTPKPVPGVDIDSMNKSTTNQNTVDTIPTSASNPNPTTAAPTKLRKKAGTPAETPKSVGEAARKYNKAQDLVNWMANYAENRAYAAIAKHIADFVPEDVTVTVVDPGKRYAGGSPRSIKYSNGVYWDRRSTDKGRGIFLRGDTFIGSNGLNERTVLHELIHSATHARIEFGLSATGADTSVGKAAQNLTQFQKQMRDYFREEIRSGEFDRKYDPETQSIIMTAIANPHETVTYGMVSPQFQSALKNIPYQGKSRFSQFVQNVARLLGIGQSKVTALHSIIDITEQLLSTKHIAGVNLNEVATKDMLLSEVRTSQEQGHSDLLSNLRAIASGQISRATPFMLRIAPLRTLVQTLGNKIPQIAQLSRHLDEANHVSTTMIEDALGNRNKAVELAKKVPGGGGEVQSLGAAVFILPAEPLGVDREPAVEFSGSQDQRG